MPATHHSSAPPTTSTNPAPPDSTAERPARRAHTGPPTPPAPTAPPPKTPSAPGAPTIGRIPVLDVRPTVHHSRRPAKAVVGEAFEISAVVIREGHDAVAANVVLRDPEGRPADWIPMRELAPGTDRWGATVSVPSEGIWSYAVEGWGDPITTWRHRAHIKIPAGIDTELVLEEGARLHERAAAEVPEGKSGRGILLAAVDALRDTARPVSSRLAAALAPEVDEVLTRHPLRELVSSSDPLPL
ncbi:maltotransferase domain-containing protein, partial [Streptomyces sp. NPDC002787]